MKEFLIVPAATGLLLLLAAPRAALGADHSQALHLTRLQPLSLATEILNANNQFRAALTGNWIDYLETAGNGRPFDRENGVQFGLSVSGSAMQDWAFRNFYLYGQLQLIDGRTQYAGAYRGQPYGSLVQSDGATIKSEQARIGKGFEMNGAFMLTPYISIGALQWSRDLRGPGGYHEDYSHGYWGGGLLVQFSPASRWVVSAHGLLGSTFDAGMETARNGGYPITPQKYALRSSTLYLAGLSVDYAVTRHLHANLGLDYVHFKYGASGVSPVDSSYEPDSKTSDASLKVGLGYAF